MKRIMLLGIGIVLSLSSCAQDLASQQIPSAVLNAFSTAYPRATDVEWKQVQQYYQVDFDLLLEDHELLIDSSGTIVKHEQEISQLALPDPVKYAIRQRYKGYHIDDADKIEQQGKTYYKVELEKGEHEIKVIFNPDGTLGE